MSDDGDGGRVPDTLPPIPHSTSGEAPAVTVSLTDTTPDVLLALTFPLYHRTLQSLDLARGWLSATADTQERKGKDPYPPLHDLIDRLDEVVRLLEEARRG